MYAGPSDPVSGGRLGEALLFRLGPLTPGLATDDQVCASLLKSR
jgi:hypothetical protein